MGTDKSKNEKAECVLQASSDDCCRDLVLKAKALDGPEVRGSFLLSSLRQANTGFVAQLYP